MIDTKRLRQKILDLAIRGKLVEQDPTDEPASVLLERIREEKLQMVADGRLKKKDVAKDSIIFFGDDNRPYEKVGDVEPVCIADEVPFELPDGWEWARLGHLGQWQSGATPKTTNRGYYKNGVIPWLVTGDLNDGLIEEIPGRITELALKETSVKLNSKGSLLIAMYGATIGKLGILSFPATTNQACCACCPLSGMNVWYMFYYLELSRSAFVAKGIGGAQKNISKEIIVDTLIPIPPLAEQKRIVAVLDEYLALVDEIERNQEELEKLLAKARSKVLDLAIRGKLVDQDPTDEPASVLLGRIREEKLQMVADGKLKKKDIARDSVIYKGEDNSYYEKVGDGKPVCIDDEVPFELPVGWSWARLSSIYLINPKNEAPDEIEASFTPMAAIEPGYTGIVHFEKRPWHTIKKGFTHFADGDIAFSKISPCFENGKYFIAHDLDNGIGAGTTELFVLRSFGSVQPISQYVFSYLGGRTFVAGATETFLGTVGQQRVKREYVETAFIPIPPLAEQERIVAAIESLIPLFEAKRI